MITWQAVSLLRSRTCRDRYFSNAAVRGNMGQRRARPWSAVFCSEVQLSGDCGVYLRRAVAGDWAAAALS